MPCRVANFVTTPWVEEVTEEVKFNWNRKTRQIEKHYERFLFPEYYVHMKYDYGVCCGIDSHIEKFTSRDSAEEYVRFLINNEHADLRYYPEFIRDEED